MASLHSSLNHGFPGCFGWRNFVSKLNCHTPMNRVWNMVQKIKGQNNKTNVLHLKDGHDTLTGPHAVSCALSNDFLNSSNEKGQLYSSKFFDLKFNLVFSFCFLNF
jgi:hypothetical protein